MARLRRGIIYFDDRAKVLDAIRKIKQKSNEVKKAKYIADGIARLVQTRHIEPLIADLRKYPPTKDLQAPTRWRSSRQHRYMMAMWRSGRIKLPHKRTNDLSKGWVGETRRNRRNLGITVKIDNTEHYAQYVVGKVGFSEAKSAMRVYERPIQPFHQDTKWVPAHNRIRPVVKEAEQYYQKEMDHWLDETLDFSDIK